MYDLWLVLGLGLSLGSIAGFWINVYKTSDEIHARVGFRVRLIEFADSLIMIAVVQY